MTTTRSTTRPNHLQASSRREFLRRAGALSVTGVAAPWAMNLAAIGEAAAQSSGSDYKALVCVFFYGGNDHGNTLIPYDEATHAQYTTLRSGLAVPRDALAATVLDPAVALPDARRYALAPQLASMKPVFDAGRLAVLLNIGTLVQPTTKAQYDAKSVPLPPKLFSHNDQQSVWQSSLAEGATSGWGGRMGDVFMAGNGQATFTAVSVSGNAVFLSGRQSVQYQVSAAGSVAVNGIANSLYGSKPLAQALRQIITTPSDEHVMLRAHVDVMQRSIAADGTLRAALAAAVPPPTVFPATPLGGQLAMVAKMISARETLGAKRQVFFVSLGGFDNHDGLLDAHPALLTQVSDALAAFDRSTTDLGVADSVTTFTASDFGRTLASNGDGSDHGWGSCHLVMGGAVNGKRFVGKAPVLGDGGADDVGQGRMLPTIAVDQFAASLATWMGLTAGQVKEVVPGIGNFDAGAVPIFV